MMKKFILALVCLLAPLGARATTVTGNLKDVGVANFTGSNSFVRFTLANFGNNIPRVSGQNVVARPFVDLHPDINGNIAGNVQGNDTITPAGTIYEICIFDGGTKFKCNNYLVTGLTFDLSTAVPIVVAPTVSGNILFARTFLFNQAVPSLTWVITHSFGDSHTFVQCADGTGQQIFPDTVQWTSINVTTVTWVVPTAGTCILMTDISFNINAPLIGTIQSNPSAPQTINTQPLTVQSQFNAVDGGSMVGPFTFTGPFTATCFDLLMGVAYVGGSCASAWGNGDIGSQINAAYAVLPSNGGEIIVIPQANAACYSFTTPIVLATQSKFVLLESIGSDSQSTSGTTSNGSCLNYTPTTSTTAISLDYVPIPGGGFTRNHGIRHLRLVNNQCITLGGCGSSATGVAINTTNSGAQNAIWDGFAVSGFGTGIKIATPASNGQASWGINFSRGTVSFNTLGISIPVGIELTMLDDMKIMENGTGVQMGGSSDLYMNGGSCDSNSVVCLKSTGGTITTSGVHYENLGTPSMAQVDAGLSAAILGGFALDDCVSSVACSNVTPAFWFHAALLHVSGQSFFTAGRIPTFVYTYDTSAEINGVANIGGSIPRANVIKTVGGNSCFTMLSASPAAIECGLFMADSSGGGAFTCGQISDPTLSGWGSTAACSNPQGGLQRFQFTITAGGAGIAANPSIAITFGAPWPIAPLYQCKMVGGTGTPALITGEQTSISPNGIGPIGYNGTPTNGSTYIISCMGI